ncbi:cysteine desulfurase [Corynebacterium pseudopelargi]|uniref:Cysteine desulfurase n=1 Tax=Corynebacterium pseudopelargi TaxID=2080757 RepID=A0A3G6IXG0_9CORY|nr:cysteine desulfurase [Corynebacterium pseudopelargi]AZA10253.1 hypothetical protein CPPEL_10810 [Corynebacterium pseudopelargi]
MAVDVARIRGLYTSLGDGWTYLDAHIQPQIPERVAAAAARAFRSAPTLPRMDAPAEQVGSHAKLAVAPAASGRDMFLAARRAVADLTDTSSDAVILGPSLPVLLSRFSRAARPLLRRDASVVLSRADSRMMNIDAPVRWAEPDVGTGEVPSWQFGGLVDGSTRLIVMQTASPQVGSVHSTYHVAQYVRAASRAWMLIDATPTITYRSARHSDLGADIVAIDGRALGVPGIAALAFRDYTMFPRIDRSAFIDDASPALAMTLASAIDHLADLDESARGTRRNRLARSIEGLAEHGEQLSAALIEALQSMHKVHVFGVTGEVAAGADVDRLPTATFAIEGVPAATIQQRLLTNGLVAAISEADPLLEAMGLGDTEGAITCGLAPFNTVADIDQLARVVASLG